MLVDLRSAARSLLRSPAFAVAAVLTLAVGIGAAASMFVLVDAYYLRDPRGVVEASRLVDVRATMNGRGEDLTYLDYADLRDRTRGLSGVLAYRPTVVDLGHGVATRRVPAALVSSNYFAVLGARLAQGRDFLPQEERATGAAAVVVISHDLWRAAFVGDPKILGRAVTVNGQRFTVVGVAQPGFRGRSVDEAFDIWVPLAMVATAAPGALGSVEDRTFRWLRVVGRLAPGVDLERARAEAAVLAQQLQRAGAGNHATYGLRVKPSQSSLLEDTYALLLLAGVALLFLTVCANLSNLFLGRANARRKEIATRLALGARRVRAVAHLLTETVLLGVLGGAVGLVVAAPAARALLAWSTATPPEFADAAHLGFSGSLVAFVVGLSVVAGVALGLGPALQITGGDLAAHLKEGGGGRSIGRSRTRSVLVIAQLALSLVLVNAGAVVFSTLRGYSSRVSVPDAGHVLLVSVQPSHEGYSDDRSRVYFSRLLERASALPGVTVASIAREVNLDDGSFFPERVSSHRSENGIEGPSLDCAYAVVSPNYFRTMGIVLSRGRDFTANDRTGAPLVVIVNATLARRLWGDADALGRTLWIAGEHEGREVVGLASDRPTAQGHQPFLYEPLYQGYSWAKSVHVLHLRTSGNALALLTSVQHAAASLDASVPLFSPRLLEREIAARRFFERLAGAILAGSGLLALLLALIGLYGVVSNWVSQSTHEIGIRIALGAQAANVLVQVLGRTMKLALAGVAIGAAVALAVNRVWTAWLFDARVSEPLVLVAAVLLLVTTALVTTYLPARRATRVDPASTLRCE